MVRTRKADRMLRTYGAAELFGRAVKDLGCSELRRLSNPTRGIKCPFKADNSPCRKKGGVCSLALFEQDAAGIVSIVGNPVTTCPTRFLERNEIFRNKRNKIETCESNLSIINITGTPV